jgi:hypothetical protein
LTVADHPHADQRNWRPEDDDDRLLHDRLVRYFVRTFERLRKWQRIHPDDIVDLISPRVRIDQLIAASEWLHEIAKSMHERMIKEQQLKCAECGSAIWFKDNVEMTISKDGKPMVTGTRETKQVRRDARYCSPSCRQKAFRKRKRVTDGTSDAPAQPSRVADDPSDAEAQP